MSEDDALPKHVCTDCEKKLTSWLSFFTKSKETQETLLQALKKKEISSTLVETDEAELNVVESCLEKSSKDTTTDDNDTTTDQQNTSTDDKVIVTDQCLVSTPSSEEKESKKVEDPVKKVEERIESKEENASCIHTCPVCKKTFSQRNKFAQHLACHVTPEPETPHLWPCPVCPKKLRSCDGLARHQETHLDSRNYCCHVCGRLFQTLPCLLNHVRVQHGPETGPGARPRHTCPICSRVFRQSTHMVQHLRTHTGIIIIKALSYKILQLKKIEVCIAVLCSTVSEYNLFYN